MAEKCELIASSAGGKSPPTIVCIHPAAISELFGKNCANYATIRLACTVSIGAHAEAQCRTTLRRERWLLGRYDLKSKLRLLKPL